LTATTWLTTWNKTRKACPYRYICRPVCLAAPCRRAGEFRLRGRCMRLQRQFASAVAAVLTMGVAAAAHAQTPPVDPGRLDERLRPPVERPDVSPIEVPTLPQQEAGPESNLAVELSAVRFEGATAVPVEVLNAIAAPYIGRRMPLSEVFRLAEEVTAEYRRRGYVLSR